MVKRVCLALLLVLLVLLTVATSARAAPALRYRVYLPVVVKQSCPPDYRQAPDPIGGCGNRR